VRERGVPLHSVNTVCMCVEWGGVWFVCVRERDRGVWFVRECVCEREECRCIARIQSVCVGWGEVWVVCVRERKVSMICVCV